jgi:hypothetical protein
VRALIPPLIVGTVLRLWNLSAQVIGGDELHAVRAALRMGLGEILTTYRLADNSIPLTALFRLLLSAGVTLSEIWLRLPSLVAGVLLLAVAPAVMARRMGSEAAAVWAWLLALSPALVLYSRIARSYMPVVFCATAAALAFEVWWRTRRPAFGVAYVLAAALAVWLHLGAAPFVAAPFLYALADLAVRPGERLSRLRGLALVGAGLLAACAAFLLPARESLLDLIAARRVGQAVAWSTVGDLLRLQAGTASWVLAALFWAVALAGLVRLLRQDRRLGAYTLTLAAGHVAGIALLSPVGLTHPVVLARYLLPALPLVLLWAASALALPRSLRWLPASAFLLALALGGPFADSGFRSSSFMHHNDLMGFHRPRRTLQAAAVSPFYRQLGSMGEGAVLELPWSPNWDSRVPYILQGIHGRRTLVSTPIGLFFRRGLAWRNLVAPRPPAFLASRARFLVVHLKPGWEEDRVEWQGRPSPGAMTPRMRQGLRRAGGRLARRLAREWGPPVYADALVQVWDLEQVREGAR